jgi:molybdenum cofactor synthesis domain-containing protein
MTSAACIVIGDEILTGKVHDQNSHTLAKILFERGVEMERVLVIPDRIPVIADTVKEWSARVDHVFTSGGIGPTHDDVTYEGVAQAFGRNLEIHAPTLAIMEEHLRQRYPDRPMNEERKRMALIPQGSEVWTTPALWVPLVVIENVHILPGIPQLFETMMEGCKGRFSGARRARAQIYTHKVEGEIAAVLGRLQKENPDLSIGSYPRIGDKRYRVMVTIEGLDAAGVGALAQIIEKEVDGFAELGDPKPGSA